MVIISGLIQVSPESSAWSPLLIGNSDNAMTELSQSNNWQKLYPLGYFILNQTHKEEHHV
uniref:Uncharacterized protein n=1 Tax=Marinobacter nauticus TaxID=2743 RepID=A0A455W2K7_MARNT|nr:hypothetical protein YBY_12840 [Marinobacter nauticus]